ncbi:hypothetical protein NE611_17385, partial [Anaerostipes caccae]|nr:hypothetical protein [Anaerostipes caccae]
MHHISYNFFRSGILYSKGFRPIGTTGIEQYYNSTLSGVDGRKYTYLNEELGQDDSIVDP